VIERVGS